MKANKDQRGFSVVEMVIAISILAVVIVGVLIAIKVMTGNESEQTAKKEDTAITAISNTLSRYVAAADLDIVYATSSTGCTLRLIGREGFQVFTFNSNTKAAFFQEKQYTSADMTDEEKISAARNTTLDTTSGAATQLADDVKIMTFIVQISDLSKDGAKLVLQLRVEDTESVYKEIPFAVNKDLIALKNGTYGLTPTPTPNVEATATPTSTPTPKPTNTPTPVPVDDRERVEISKGSILIQYETVKEYVEEYGEDAVIYLTGKFDDPSGKAAQGWGVGGISIDGVSVSGTKFEVSLTYNPKFGDELTCEFKLGEILAAMDELGGKTIQPMLYNGYSIKLVEICY